MVPYDYSHCPLHFFPHRYQSAQIHSKKTIYTTEKNENYEDVNELNCSQCNNHFVIYVHIHKTGVSHKHLIFHTKIQHVN